MSGVYRSLFFPNHFTVASRWMSHKPQEKATSNDFLYVIANGPSFPDKEKLFLKAMQAVQGGASYMQYMDHRSDFSPLLKTCLQLQKMLQRVGVPLMINTRYPIEIARAVGAAGVYLEEGFPVSEARTILGEKAIIGIPVKTKEEVIAAEKLPVNFLSVKVALSQRTSPGHDTTWGSEGLREVRAISSHQLVAVGAMTPASAEQIYSILRADDMIAMAGGIMDAEDPRAVAQEMHMIWQRVRKES